MPLDTSRFVGVETLVTVDITVTQVAKPDPTRVFLSFHLNNNGGSVGLSTRGDVTWENGIPPGPGGGWPRMWKDQGSLACSEWFGIADPFVGNPVILTRFEVFDRRA